MIMSKFLVPITLAGTFLLSSCGGTQWSTDYSDVISPQVSKGWRVTSVQVSVPDTLTVSEQNSYAPNADIVWRGDPIGDRRAQVDKIMTDAIKRGASGLRGGKPVRLVVTMQQFHALSDRARSRLQKSGVHDITFTAQVLDARTGKPLSPPDVIKADLVAYVGDQAIAAMRQGQTQKIRISNHVARVIAGWLGHGEDVRNTFTRNGR